MPVDGTCPRPVLGVVFLAFGLAACRDDAVSPAARGIIDRGATPVSAPAAATPGPTPETGATPSPVPELAEPSPALPNHAPTIGGAPVKAVLAGASFSFRPTASDPDGDALTFTIANAPRWASFEPKIGRLRGLPGPGDIGRYENVRISVSDGSSSVGLAPFTVDVLATALGTITVSWVPASEREDGWPLTNLKGHKIYWGTVKGIYPSSVLIDNPGITRYVIDGLIPATYFLVATTIDGNGVESDFSATAQVTVR